MKIFISYASEDYPKAEEIALALQGQGHKVFFDRVSLTGSEDYHSVIRQRIEDAALFIFLISPHSVEGGGYSLSELRMARDKWPHPHRHVLPVMLQPTDMSSIPVYLRGVTIFQPEGNTAAEIAAYVKKRFPTSRKRIWIGSALLIMALLIFFLIRSIQGQDAGTEDTDHYQGTIEDFVSGWVWYPEMIERVEYTLDPTSDFPAGNTDIAVVERVAAGIFLDSIRSVNITFTISNSTEQVIKLDLTSRFFSLKDDQGHEAELLFFCCPARGEMLGVGQERRVQLIFRYHSRWEGKEIATRRIYFAVEGFLPLVRGVWAIRPLATAD